VHRFRALTRIVTTQVQVSASILRGAAALGLALGLLAGSAGCMYLFSEKRTVYQYEPAYGVDSPQFRRSLDALGTEMVPGNRAALLQDAGGIFPRMLDAIASARASINMEMYIFGDDETGTRFARGLAERARAGIEVRVLVDGFGSSLGPLSTELEKAGVKVRIYKPLRIYSIDTIGNRTHRRILTIDGHIGFCGGVGLDDRWKEWRETMIEVEGPVVAQLQQVFAKDWVHTTGEVLNGDRQFPRIPPAGDVLAQVIAASRADAISMSKLVLYMAIQASRTRVWIENAYFIPDGQIRQALVAAAKRGVDVKIIVPGAKTDSPNVRAASRYHFGELLEAGIAIYEYRPTMMHNKVMVVDSIWSTVGSINFVNRSMKKNAEINVAVYDRRFAAEVEAMVQEDLTRCDVLTLREWKRRGLPARIGETFFWLFSENY
jgi:cardiolipin synthase A/B